MNPLHIAFFNRSFYPDTAATGQLLTELCEGLVRDHGCKISVVAGSPLIPSPTNGDGLKGGLLFKREQHNGVDVIRAHGTRFSKRRFSGGLRNYVCYFLLSCYS